MTDSPWAKLDRNCYNDWGGAILNSSKYMSIILFNYNESAVRNFFDKQEKKSFSYKPLFLTKNIKSKVKGYDYDTLRVKLGTGRRVFEIAKQAIKYWKMFPEKWTRVHPIKPEIGIGETVAISAKYLGMWWVNMARIVYVVEDLDTYGFAYGTLPGHVEKGEELFLVRMDEHEDVFYEIIAISKPNILLAKMSYSLLRGLQKKFRENSATEIFEYVKKRK